MKQGNGVVYIFGLFLGFLGEDLGFPSGGFDFFRRVTSEFAPTAVLIARTCRLSSTQEVSGE